MLAITPSGLLAGPLAAEGDSAKGNKMAFAGLKKDQQVADLLAFLKEETL